MGETLEEGLNALFGAGAAAQPRTAVQDSVNALATREPAVIGGVAAPTAPAGAAPSGAFSELLRQAQTHYERAIAAQKAGNWAEYGREIELLGATLRSLRAGKQ